MGGSIPLNSQLKNHVPSLSHSNQHPVPPAGAPPIREHFKVNYNDSLGKKLEDLKAYDQRAQKFLKSISLFFYLFS